MSAFSFASFASFVALILQSWAGLVHAEAPFAFDRAPGRLPKEIVPRGYRIELEPDSKTALVRGRETIAIEVRKPVREIVLNSVALEIAKASLKSGTGERRPLAFHAAPELQTIAFSAEQDLAPGGYELDLEWSGALTEREEGLFITRYQAGKEEKRALATQMEPADARRMFPCWDEPAFRAVFELSVVVPENDLAVSNMPVVRETLTGHGSKRVDFAATPAMATYLVALCAGEFEQLNDEIDGVRLRVVTTEGKVEQARYALEATKKILPFYNEYFGVRYPLPKLDQFCFPGFPAGGMENWGAIFYNDRTMLVDPVTSSASAKQHVFAVIAHEIAHQWFGDLVTMGWWDNLWLNEGFASWMGTKATDRFNPEWQIWLRAASNKERAMSLDARATTHPIQQAVPDERQARDAFDEITYSKGQAFLRMLETRLGERAFKQGIQQYIAEHAYGNTTTADLWSALETASGEPVRKMASGWTERPGFPVIHVDRSPRGNGWYEFTQERFVIHQANPEPLVWEIPVRYGGSGPSDPVQLQLLEKERASVELSGTPPIRANVGSTGFYRVSYDAKIFNELEARCASLSDSDRLDLLDDTWAMLEAGRLGPGTFMEFVTRLAPEERSYAVWSQMLSTLSFIDDLETGQAGRSAFRAWARNLIRPELARLGWSARPAEGDLAASLRGVVVGALGTWDDDEVSTETNARYEAFLDDPSSLPADLRSAVLSFAGRHANAETYERLHDFARQEVSTELKQQYYEALAACEDTALAGRTLQLALSTELPPSLAAGLVLRVASHREHTDLAWSFTRQNLEPLLAKLDSSGATHFVPNLLSNFSDAARADELEAFARGNLPPETNYSVAKAADEIRFKAEFKGRLLKDLEGWLAKQSQTPKQPEKSGAGF